MIHVAVDSPPRGGVLRPGQPDRPADTERCGGGRHRLSGLDASASCLSEGLPERHGELVCVGPCLSLPACCLTEVRSSSEESALVLSASAFFSYLLFSSLLSLVCMHLSVCVCVCVCLCVCVLLNVMIMHTSVGLCKQQKYEIWCHNYKKKYYVIFLSWFTFDSLVSLFL